MVAAARAVEALASPLEWGSQDAWLAESVKRVRHALGVHDFYRPLPAAIELEELLRLQGEQPGWLRAELASTGGTCTGGRLPASSAGSENCLPAVTMRCALACGVSMLRQLEACRSMLGQLGDDMNTGFAIFQRGVVREVAQNTRWSELLDEEPERFRLLELISRQVGHRGASVDGVREIYEELDLSGRSYRLVTREVPAGTLLPEPAVLVLMERLGPELPTTRELRVSFGLRGREPQIALLAAEGLSNEAIAQRLRLSSHTVRHYLERVLTRLGLHSRKALALHLMAGEREKPPGE